MNTLKDQLNILLQVLKKNNSPVIDMLQGPISRGDIDLLIGKLNINLPNEVYELFGWRNGVRTPEEYFLGQTWMFPLGGFFPIQNAIEQYNYYAGKDEYWKESMFLLFESGGGEMYLIECNKESSQYGMIFKHSDGAIDYEVIISAYDSLQNLITTIIQCYKKGAYICNPKTGVRIPDMKANRLHISICKKNNPNSDLWKLYDE